MTCPEKLGQQGWYHFLRLFSRVFHTCLFISNTGIGFIDLIRSHIGFYLGFLPSAFYEELCNLGFGCFIVK